MAPKWIQIDDRLLQQTRVFDLRAKRMRASHIEYEDDFYYIRANDWVNIIPVTEAGEVILIEQHRHGTGETSLEIPGGIIDQGETDPKAAGIRELEEETGYRPETVISLGAVHPNPAIFSNRCHFFLARGCKRTGQQALEPAEDITLRLVRLDEIPQLLACGAISHALMVAAFGLLYAQGHEPLGTR